MAKIIIEADTEKMTLNCSVDGEKLKNVHEVSFYHYPETSYSKEKLDFRAMTMEENKNGVKKMMYVYANKQLNSHVVSDPKTQVDIQNAIAKALVRKSEK